MNKIISLCLFFVLVLLNSCKNDENPTSPNNNTTSEVTSNQLMKKGTWFKYNRNMAGFNGVITSTVVGEKVINGKTYAELSSDMTTDKAYMREANNVVYQLLHNKDNDTYTEIKSADFNLKNVDDTWMYENVYKNTLSRYKSTYLGSNFKYTLKGKEYTATKFKLSTYIVLNGTEMLLATQYNWYIKGIGYVAMDSDYGTDELIDYGTN